MACHWLSLGLEIESLSECSATDHLDAFRELTNREHSWQLEQL
jgi:hypothetical protein